MHHVVDSKRLYVPKKPGIGTELQLTLSISFGTNTRADLDLVQLGRSAKTGRWYMTLGSTVYSSVRNEKRHFSEPVLPRGQTEDSSEANP